MISAGRLQFLLAQSHVFQSRVQMQLLAIAAVVLAEQDVGDAHARRAIFANQCIQNPEGMARNAAFFVAQSTNVVAAGITMEDEGVRCAVEDAALFGQMTADWDKLAGVDSGN
jgi:hypothetical protein